MKVIPNQNEKSPEICPSQKWKLFNPKRNMRGQHGPRKSLTGAGIIIITIPEPMFYLILVQKFTLLWLVIYANFVRVLEIKQPELVANFAHLSCHAIRFLGSARTPHIL